VQLLNPPGDEPMRTDTLWDDEDPDAAARRQADGVDRDPASGRGHELAPDIGGVAVAEQDQAVEGIVREVTVPLTLTIAEIRRSRKLRLKITLDVTID